MSAAGRADHSDVLRTEASAARTVPGVPVRGDEGGASGAAAQRRRWSAARWRRPPHRWLVLLLMLRAAAVGAAIALLALHRVTDIDRALTIAVIAYAAVTGAAVFGWPRLTMAWPAWVVDVSVVFALVWISGDWRSPFYLLALTSLALPAAGLGTRRAVALGGAYTAAYLWAAHVIGPDPLELGSQASMESLAAHLALPGMVCLGVGYAAETLRRFERQRRKAERLAIETERRRIAWELHDSAKQRIHAAHLVISSLAGSTDETTGRIVDQALTELRAAAAEMESSVAELQEPLLGRPLDVALRERAEQLTVAGGPDISVTGRLPELPPLQAAHAYRVGAEALTNAVRHAGARRIEVALEQRDGLAHIAVSDDGAGLPEAPRPGSTGMLAMRSRARSIGGRLRLGPNEDGRGTLVTLEFPLGVEDA